MVRRRRQRKEDNVWEEQRKENGPYFYHMKCIENLRLPDSF